MFNFCIIQFNTSLFIVEVQCMKVHEWTSKYNLKDESSTTTLEIMYFDYFDVTFFKSIAVLQKSSDYKVHKRRECRESKLNSKHKIGPLLFT